MERLYRRLLFLYPRAYRAEFGAAMSETFACRSRAARNTGLLHRLRFLGREAAGIVRTAVRERFGPADRRPPPRRRGIFTGLGFRHAIRRLASSPGFTLATVLTLALGIGGSTAIFTVVNSILIEPLPYPDADRLVAVAVDVAAVNANDLELPKGFWLGYRSLNESFDEIGLYSSGFVNLTGEGTPERVAAVNATGSVFATLGVRPALGRAITEDDEMPGAPPIVVLSQGLWQRRFGADASLLGEMIRVNGVATEVVGVMPEAFAYPRPDVQVWLPLEIDRSAEPPLSFSYSSVGRLAPGITLDAADLDLQEATRRLPEIFGNITEDFLEEYGVAPSLREEKEKLVGAISDTLWLLLGAVGFVLLIACANVANLFLVRTEARRREIGLRAALGASRGDLVRHLLSESLVIGVAAGTLGVGLALVGVRLLVTNGPEELPRLGEVALGTPEIAFAAVISALVALAFGALPALRMTASTMLGSANEWGDRSTESGGSRRVTGALVVSQVAFALLLMVGAALFAQSLRNLIRIDPGFRAEGVLTLRLSLDGEAYPDDAQRAVFHQALLDRLEALPGIDNAGLTRCLPLQGWCGGNPVSSPDSPLQGEDFRDVVSLKPVSPGYFESLGIELRSGRTIERSDHEQRADVAVISEALAARLFPGMDPLGKRVYPSEAGPEEGAAWYSVVGVVGTVKRVELAEEPADILYVPMVTSDDTFLPNLNQVTVVVRTTGDPLDLAAVARDAVWSIDPDVPVAGIETMESILRRASARVAFTAVLVGIAALVALSLGAIGIYGVVSHAASRRTAEIGVRMALGAQRGEVLRMVLRQGIVLVGIGVAVGLAGALSLSRVVEALLYDVSAVDPVVLVGVSTALLAVAVLASLLPAHRAASIDPADSLRD